MKKILATLLLGTALAVAALPVSAAGVDNTVTLTANGNTASVHLDLPENEAKGVTALRLSFQVNSSDDIAAKFVFDDSLTASVQQYTYNEQTQILHVYLAGRNELLSKDGEADLGTIQLDGAEGSTASVSFVVDSLELVDASLGKTETSVVSNGDANLTVSSPSNPTPAPETTPAPEATPVPETTPAPTQAPSGGSTSGNAGQDGSSGSQNSGVSQQENSDESSVTSTATSTDAPAATTKPSAGQSTSGSKTPSSTSTATPTPEATATPDKDTQVQQTPAPSESTPAPAETATPEQSLAEQDSGSQLPVVPIAIAVVVVVAAIIGVAVIRFRG